MAVEPGRQFHYSDGLFVEYGHIGNKCEPCVFLAREAWGRQSIFCIPLSQAYAYRDDQTLIERTLSAMAMLGLGQAKSTCHKLASIIQQHLDDLVHLPPKAAPDRAAMIEHAVEHQGLRLSVNGERVIG